jgi:hypothetical protein
MRKAEGGGDHLMVVDGKGRVQYATSHLADLLGTTPKAMVKQEFCKFMAQPFQQLHTRWMKVRRWWMGGVEHGDACSAERPVTGPGQGCDCAHVQYVCLLLCTCACWAGQG